MSASRSFARLVSRLLAGATDIRQGEGRTVLASGALFFLVLAVVMVLRPVREAIALESGIENVRVLFVGTLGAMILLVPAFGYLVSHVPRRVFLSVSYHACAVLLLGFYFGLTFFGAQNRAVLGPVYYVAHSVFNLFLVSLFWTQVATLLAQAFVAGRIMRFVGVGTALALLPLYCTVGFALVAAAPTLPAYMLVNALYRAVQRGVTRPARETLFTVLDREDKDKAKSFLDTFVSRAGDAGGAQMERSLAAFDLGVTGLLVAVLPIAVMWSVLSLILGAAQTRLAPADSQDETP